MHRYILLPALLFTLVTASCGPAIQPAESDSWIQLASMPTPRSENAAAVVGDVIYVSGGFGGEQTLEAYDTTTDAWATLAEMPEPRHHLMSASYAGKVYIFGGGNSLPEGRMAGWSTSFPSPSRGAFSREKAVFSHAAGGSFLL